MTPFRKRTPACCAPRLCKKASHDGGGYLHDPWDDEPYDVDGVEYCGRCHAVLSACAARASVSPGRTDPNREKGDG